MAVISHVERLGYDHDWSTNQDGPVRDYTRYFWVYSDTRAEDPIAIRLAPGIVAGDAHPTDSGAVAQRFRCRRDEELPTRWELEIQYSSNLPRTRDEESDVEDYEKVSIVTRKGSRLVERDRNGDLVRNTAGDPILGLEIPWNALAIQIEQYTTSDPDYYITSKWINAINSDPWRGVPAYFARIDSLTFNEATYNGVDCWKRTAIVELAHVDSQPWGWRYRVLNAGIYEKKPSGVRSHIRVGGSMSLAGTPQPLKADGSKADIPGGDTPYFFDIETNPEFNFATLGI